MTLRTKTLVQTLLLVAALFVGMYFLLSTLVAQGFLDLEDQSIRTDITRAEKVFQDEFEHLEQKSADWAQWDDAYQFAKDNNTEFVESNFVGGALASMRLEFIVVYDANGRFVNGIEADAKHNHVAPSAEIQSLHAARPALFDRARSGPVKAGVRFSFGFSALVLRPILRSDGAGPSAGFLMFGRIVNAEFAAGVADQAQLALDLLPIGVDHPFDERVPSIAKDLRTQGRAVHIQDDTSIHGYSVIKDIDERPAILMRVTAPRRIVAQGARTQQSVLLGLLFASISYVLLSLLILERGLLRRLTSMIAAVQKIAAEQAVDRRVADEGSDELGVLAREINAMLAALEIADQETQRARQVAEQAASAKSLFLANMSHELRTPINGIVGMAQVMLNVEQSKQRRESLSIIKNSGRALLELINLLLDQAKAEAGKIELEQKPFALRQVLLDILKPLAIKTHEKGLELRLVVPASIPNELLGDALRIRQIITNLVGNGIKFTEFGAVTVALELTKEADKAVHLRWRVQDTGIGMSPLTLQKVFQPFTQADSSTTRRFGGTGLGLSIAKSLVELMGGRIWVESEEGVGTEFLFEVVFPLAEGTQPTEQPIDMEVQPILESDLLGESDVAPPRANGRCLKVLVADDTRINQTVAKALLEQWGHSVTLAASGIEALGQLEATGHLAPSAPAGASSFDLVLMDIQMPGLDGVETTAIIRQREGQLGRPRVPIVAVTAHASARDAEQFISQGMDDCVEKPIDHHALIGMMTKLFPELEGSPPQAAIHQSSQSAFQVALQRASVGVINAEELFSRFADDSDIVTEVLRSFLDEIPVLMKRLLDAFEAGAADGVARAAHALKGSLANISAESVAARCYEMDVLAKKGDLSAAYALVSRVQSDIATITALATKLILPLTAQAEGAPTAPESLEG